MTASPFTPLCLRRSSAPDDNWMQPNDPWSYLVDSTCVAWHYPPIDRGKATTMGNPRELTLTGRAKEAALNDMYAEISARNMFPFWAKSSYVEHDEIRQLMSGPKPVPFRWSYKDDIESLLHRSAELVTTEDTDRRSLVLINPGLAPRRATVSTLYTAYRLNDPNEIMPPHRHTASAIRFGLTGTRNFTGVEGENITFGPGDMVLTMRELLEKHRDFAENPHEGLLIEYIDPLTGGPVYRTMTFFMQMVRKGETTLPAKQSASLLVAPFEGRGHALVDGTRFELEPFDTVAIPGSHWVEYANDGSDPLILFVASDEPALAAFGLLTRYGRGASGDVVKLI